MPEVHITEVGPRDGLQNEKIQIPLELKVKFVNDLINSGLLDIEATSFVSPKWVPQLADASDLVQRCSDHLENLMVLVPNQAGLDRAIASGIKRIAFFTAASDAFTLKNINKTVEESIRSFEELITQFREINPDGWVRCYVSTIVECPYAGRIDPAQVAKVVDQVLSLGVDEVSLGETIGVAIPDEISSVAKAVEPSLSIDKTVWHFHDTRGTGIANVAKVLDMGYRRFDSSAGGLGGCPYAPGAGGNIATEDLVYFCERSGLATGVNLSVLAEATLPVLAALGRSPSSKAQRASLALR